MTTKPESESKWVEAVLFAVLNTPHAITAQKIVLEFDRSKPGHNATNQLHLRIEAAGAAYLTKQDALMAQLANALDDLAFNWCNDMQPGESPSLDAARKAIRAYKDSK